MGHVSAPYNSVDKTKAYTQITRQENSRTFKDLATQIQGCVGTLPNEQTCQIKAKMILMQFGCTSV